MNIVDDSKKMQLTKVWMLFPIVDDSKKIQLTKVWILFPVNSYHFPELPYSKCSDCR